jgi:beta-galactosidase
MMKTIKLKVLIVIAGCILAGDSFMYAQRPLKRNIISLNGTWQIAEGKNNVIPKNFNHTVPVPGLVSLASPAFIDAGPMLKNRDSLFQYDTLREAFWYRRIFTVQGAIPAIATLKVSRAMFGTKVFLNGKDLGEHLPCFTPGFFNVKDALKTGENELLVRVGSSRNAVPLSIPNGFDFEKERYIPGIYDKVELILAGTPHIIRIQAVPDISNKQLRVQLNVANSGEATISKIDFAVREVKSKKMVGQLSRKVKLSGYGKEDILDVKIPIKNSHLWSPEDPFLYTLEVNTDADETSTRFGMREFHFDTVTKRAVLNGKPYFLRGSNVTLYRFFEDSTCKDLPWNSGWVRKLHKSFKQFHWNSLRYCIGFPPEEWYRIADEEGFLIQDEFPIWYGGTGWCSWPKELKTDELVNEYTEWMQDHWNHPCVVIWDASNETVCNNGTTDETGEAVSRVRSLDLSNRPWDNSYSPVRGAGDVFEAHPYHFQDPKFQLKDIAKAGIIPEGNNYPNTRKYPVIINEYGWLWLNRDGSTTTLTRDLYKNLLGENSTVAQRRHVYATYLAAETEFWRCHRQSAGVLHFTALGYSRNDGQTSDHFLNVKKIQYESEFLKYMPDAFAPTGLMLDEWGNEIETAKSHDFRIIAINDLEQEWKGSVRLQIMKDGKVITGQSSDVVIASYGQKTLTIPCITPQKPGLYTVVALLEKEDEKPVKSIREIMFK